MVNLIYQGSSGNRYDLKAVHFRTRNADFHKWGWRQSSTSRRFGESVSQWRKDSAEYEIEVVVSGALDERRKLLEAIHREWARDLYNNTCGRLYWGSCYIECFITDSDTAPDKDNLYTINTFNVFCPYPFWIEEQTVSIRPLGASGGTVAETDKGYPYGYAYSYAASQTATQILVDNALPCNFRMVAYGAIDDKFSVTIGGHIYEVQHSVPVDGVMVIDSRELTPTDERCYVIDGLGQRTNVFDYRSPESSLFEKIPAGIVTVDYSRAYGIDLTIYKERNEPR